MTHIRKQIRDALIVLVTGLTTTGTRVFAFRRHRMQPANLPGLLVYFDGERASVEGTKTGGARLLQRSALYLIQGVVSDSATLEDDLDTLVENWTRVLSENLADPTVKEKIELIANATGRKATRMTSCSSITS